MPTNLEAYRLEPAHRLQEIICDDVEQLLELHGIISLARVKTTSMQDTSVSSSQSRKTSGCW
jgi:hypothetical protein